MRWFFLTLFIWIASCAPNVSDTSSDIENSELSAHNAFIFNNGDELRVRYELLAPMTELNFSDRDTQQRRIAFSVVDDGFEFDGETLKRADGTSFGTVTFLLERDGRFFDRRYVAIDDIGPMSWSIYLTAFSLKNQNTYVTFHSDDELIVRIGADSHELDKPYPLSDKNVMSYFGRPEYVRSGDAFIIAGPEMPKWLIDDVYSNVSQTMRTLEAGFSTPAVNKPTLYLTTGPYDRGTSIKGGQLDNAVMTFRYRGVDFENFDKSQAQRISNTSAHEAAHLWIGGVYSNERNEEEPWMSEGGTEYLADRARNKSAEIKEEFEQRLNKCLRQLQMRPLDGSDGPIHGPLVYDCGYVLHTAAEIAALKKSNASIMDLWSHMITKIDRDDKSYEPADFISAVEDLGGPEYGEFAALFLRADENPRWLELSARARKIGLELELLPKRRHIDTQLLVGQWLMPVLAANCEGSHGFYNNDDAKILDGEQCEAPIENGMELVSVNAISLIDDPFLALNDVRSKCAEKGDLIFGLKDGSTLEPISCEIEIPDLPPYYQVTNFPSLPAIAN